MSHNQSSENRDNPRGRASFEPRRSAKKSAETAGYWEESGATMPAEESAASAPERDEYSKKRPQPEASAAENVIPERRARVSTASDSTETWSAAPQIIKGNAVSASGGSVFWPLFLLVVIVVVVAFILPDLPVFSHKIEVEQGWNSILSSSDIESLRIVMDQEGSDVIKLQKSLHTLGYLSFEDITGKYDTTTHNAVNNALESNGVKENGGCSTSGFEAIIKMAEEASAVSASDAADGTVTSSADAATESTTPTEATVSDSSVDASASTTTSTQTTETPTQTTSAATAAEENKTKMARITAERWTKLRRTADKKGVALYNLNNGEEYEIMEEMTDENGVLWYRLKYFYTAYHWRSGWALAEDIEVFYQ